MRPRRSLALGLASLATATIAIGGAQGFAIDKSEVFLGPVSMHGTVPGGVHEQITKRAILAGMPKATDRLIAQIQAGVVNVDVLHHFDAEYHFDSASVSSPVPEHRRAFEKAFATVHSHLKGARPLADRNPEFFAPSHHSYRAIVASLASALARLSTTGACASCSRAGLAASAAAVSATLPHFAINKVPDPHQPTNPASMFAPNLPTARCGLCGLLAPANLVSVTFQRAVRKAAAYALAQSRGLPVDHPLRTEIARIDDAFDAYRAFQAIGHAFHATQDFFAHTNYVELLAGIPVEQPIPASTVVPLPRTTGGFTLAGLRALMGETYARLQSGSSAAIWMGEGDYCLGSPYNPPTRTVLFRLPLSKTVADRLGIPREIAVPGGKNPRPPRGLDYCHYPSRGVGGARTPGLNKDEPGRKEPSHVNHAAAVTAATTMTTVLWADFLRSVRRPTVAPTPKPEPKPKPKPTPGIDPKRPWHGDWAWSYTPKGGSSASPGVMTIYQPSATKVCLRWPWSPMPNGVLGHGSGNTTSGSRKLRFTHEDAFGKGTHDVELDANGRMTGTYTATSRANGAKVTGTISATRVGQPTATLTCP